jgi:hypothetical protein
MSQNFQQGLRRWLGRLSFSFLIIACVLLWTGYKDLTGDATHPRRTGRALLCFVGGGACMALASAGMRERHRRYDEDDERNSSR